MKRSLSVHAGNTEPTQQRCQRHPGGKSPTSIREEVRGCRTQGCGLAGVGQRLEGRRRIVMKAVKRKIAAHDTAPPERPCCCRWRKVLRAAAAAAAAVSLVTESGEIMK